MGNTHTKHLTFFVFICYCIFVPVFLLSSVSLNSLVVVLILVLIYYITQRHMVNQNWW